jgi:DNA-binding transcriptional LysR family regulator
MHNTLYHHQDSWSMDIAEIETFVAIAELGGFTRAAQRLRRTQPAISRRLGLLEHELGAPMFERIRGNIRLTEAGRAFLPHAEAALAALKDGREAVRELQAGLRGTVSLALVGTLADTHIVGVLRQFARRAKDVRLELRTASSSEVTNLVRRGDASLGLRYFSSDRTELVSLDAAARRCWWSPPPITRWPSGACVMPAYSPTNAGSAFRRDPANAIPPVMSWHAS